MSAGESNQLRAVVDQIVRERIKSGEIVNVVVTPEIDYDGSEIIRIDVIFDNKSERLDPGETSQLTLDIWKRLIKLDVSGFPMLSFIAKSEAGKLAAA